MTYSPFIEANASGMYLFGHISAKLEINLYWHCFFKCYLNRNLHRLLAMSKIWFHINNIPLAVIIMSCGKIWHFYCLLNISFTTRTIFIADIPPVFFGNNLHLELCNVRAKKKTCFQPFVE